MQIEITKYSDISSEIDFSALSRLRKTIVTGCPKLFGMSIGVAI